MRERLESAAGNNHPWAALTKLIKNQGIKADLCRRLNFLGERRCPSIWMAAST
jgi:hypothetical protein